jgi:pentatricopeptide repeat protein
VTLKSHEPAAAHRAEAILRHMERRFDSGESKVQPDAASYNNVIHAWSMSSEEEATQRAESVFRRMELAYAKGNQKAHPDLISYNSMINLWSKSRHPEAGERAMEILRQMKEDDECRPDIFAYTSVIDCLAKCGSLEASEKAIALLTEVESEYEKSGEAMLRPNIRSYTGVSEYIGRRCKKLSSWNVSHLLTPSLPLLAGHQRGCSE